MQCEFLAELEELVEHLFQATDELRRAEAHGPLRREVLARIFRHVHSLKGVAATGGFDNVSALAHQTESLLERARSGHIAIEDVFIDALEEATNAISESLSADAANAGDGAGPATDPALSINQRLHDLALQNEQLAQRLSFPDLPAELAASLNEGERQLMLEAIRENENLYVVTAEFDLNVFDKAFHELRAALTQHGVVISSLPSATGTRPDRVGFRVFCSSELELEEFRNHLGAFSALEIATVPYSPAAPVTTSETKTASPSRAPVSLSSNAVRIEVEEIDRLISASHELFGQTVTALELISDNLPVAARVELKNLDAQIRQSLVSLEEQIIQLRMVSLERIMQRAIRAGRVAARLSGKEVEFDTVGSELRIDKIVCDGIADPLLHLVRNAVDLGIESTEERKRAGKNPAGTVRIEASSTGGRVRFLVADDGRGIDPKVISAAAIKLGLSIGRGTEFEIRLPAALGVLRALLVSSGGRQYCLDASQIVESVVQRNGEIKGEQTFRWDDEILPLKFLQELLTPSPAKLNGPATILICKIPGASSTSTDRRLALVVEGTGETQEVLVRSLGRHAGRWPGVAGAAELRDGEVALVIDLPLLLSLAGNE